ncbi:MAG TPA: RNA 2',3'-cyclic phosphodiesterase [Opitutaceae bacterium]|nr:RNA 2',3'-cyclic phosphodiesterase [Opitutaceae bacterium]
MPFEQHSDRLFVGIPLPDVCRSVLSELMDPLDDVRWTRPEQLHLTLRFLGEILDDQAERIVTNLARVDVASFLLPLEGVGLFPPRGNPKILWVGLGQAHTRLFQLRQKIDDALLAAGWTGDMRSFEPHITVGRVATGPGRSAENWARQHKDFAGPPFRVSHFQLVASDLTRSGATHRVREDFPLRD